MERNINCRNPNKNEIMMRIVRVSVKLTNEERTINMVVPKEGKIAINIQENKITKREMAANVTTYVIFISFATIAAAPVLFALSGVLIRVISNLGGTLGGGASAASTSGFGITFSGGGIEYADFRIFAVVTLIITSFFSAVIIATIKKGNIRSGLKYIPIFIIITVTLFLIADRILGKLLGVVF